MAQFIDLVLRGDELGNDLRGDEGNDRIAGNDGDDFLNGGSGHDLLLGGRGRDLVQDGNGNDILYGGIGNDTLYGGSGKDVLSGDEGFDSLVGGFGEDTFSFNVATGLLGDGFDTVSDFVVGFDKLAIVNGSIANVTFVDEGANLGVFYDGVKIAVLNGVASVPVDTSVLFGDII